MTNAGEHAILTGNNEFIAQLHYGIPPIHHFSDHALTQSQA